jgi:beta-galactosidase
VPVGVDWYPEQHPEDRWADDVRRMREAGLTVVRLGEFAWTAMEPREGEYHFDWLDRAVELAVGAGLQVVLGTPTAVPPVWLCLAYPEVLSVGADGHRRAYGSRRFACPTSPAYREASRRIAAAMVERYGSHDGVIAWQLDNEPGNHDSARCWCDLCERAFQAWLAERHGTIEALNAAWGMRFWSGTFPSFEALRLPRPTNAQHTPSLLLAHWRFATHQVVEALRLQREVVAAGAPGRDIFINLPADETAVDSRAIARLAGAAAIDLYPHGHGTPDDQGFLLQLHRGHTGRAWIMEHQPGPINWTPTAAPVPPGQVRLWGWRAILHGYEAFLFFSWRPARSGSEQYHTGLLRHDGSPDRGLAEAARLAAELGIAEPWLIRRPPAPVAVTWSVDDHWAIGIDPHRPGLTHQGLCVAAYAAARRLGWEVDVVAPEDDLSGYRAVLAPALHLATEARLRRLTDALAKGTLVILGPRSLVKDAEDCWLEQPLPGGLAERLGSRVTDWFGLHEDVPVDVGEDGRSRVSAGPWAEILEQPRSTVPARVAARYGSGWMSGLPAAVANDGLAYLGAASTEAWEALLEDLLGVGPAGRTGADEERFTRAGRTITIDHRTLRVRGIPDLGGGR